MCESDSVLAYQIPGFSDYFATKSGEIFSIKSGVLENKIFYQSKCGYCTVGLTPNGSGLQKRYKAHRIIAMTFLDNPKNLPIVNHINGNKQDNRLVNLEWVSPSRSTQHAYENNLITINLKAVIQLDDYGNVIAEYASIKEASQKTNTSHPTISAVCLGKRRTAGGFHWVTKEEYESPSCRKFGLQRTVEQYTVDWEFVKSFETVHAAAKYAKVSAEELFAICKGGRKVIKGSKWIFASEKKPNTAEHYKDWAVLPEFPNYRISKEGQLYSINRDLLMKKTAGKAIRKFLSLRNKDGKKQTVAMHALVARAYISNPKPGNYEIVNHLDGEPLNNNVSNLEWANHSTNGQHSYDTGLNTNKFPVIQLTLKGKEVARFDSVKAAAAAMNVSRTAMSYALNGKTKTSNGYKWKYAPK